MRKVLVTGALFLTLENSGEYGDDGVPLEHAGRFVAGDFHRHGLGYSRINHVPRGCAAEVMELLAEMSFRPDLSDDGRPDSPNRLKPSRLRYGDATRAPDGTEGRSLIRDTWNTEIVDVDGL